MASTIRATRLAQGVSVNELVSRLEVTPSAVSQLERSEAQGTIKLNSLREALAALGSDVRLTAGPTTALSRYAPFRVADSVADALDDGDPVFALRLLTHGAQELIENYSAMDAREIDVAPTGLADPRWDTLFRATYELAIPRSAKPAWTRTSPLPEPWFVSRFAILRERARSTTPDHLRRLNIFIDANSLGRV